MRNRAEFASVLDATHLGVCRPGDRGDVELARRVDQCPTRIDLGELPERNWKLTLHRLTEGSDQRLQLGRSQEVHLVDQEDDAALVLAHRLAECDKKVGEILIEFTAICESFGGLDIQPRLSDPPLATVTWKDFSTAAAALSCFIKSR